MIPGLCVVCPFQVESGAGHLPGLDHESSTGSGASFAADCSGDQGHYWPEPCSDVATAAGMDSPSHIGLDSCLEGGSQAAGIQVEFASERLIG